MEETEMNSARTVRHHFVLIIPCLVLATLACGPIGPISGGRLGGPVHQGPPPQWQASSEIETIQLESRPDDPHSVNVWFAVDGGVLYVPTSLILGPDDPEEREWVRNTIADPRVRLRIDGTVYPLHAARVEDEEERERVRAVFVGKYDIELDEHANRSWLFRMTAR
jgi:hypothetical protein